MSQGRKEVTKWHSMPQIIYSTVMQKLIKKVIPTNFLCYGSYFQNSYFCFHQLSKCLKARLLVMVSNAFTCFTCAIVTHVYEILSLPVHANDKRAAKVFCRTPNGRRMQNDSEVKWLGSGNWVNQVSGNFAPYNDPKWKLIHSVSYKR